MSEKYLPLFRKYRPQSFKDVVGQESLVKALSNAIELNKIANAYLFSGPRGTGKTSSARIFAKSLNCKEGPTLTPCQKCPSCLDITNASGLDVIEIDAATNRGIEDAKELIAQVQYAPMNGKYKIFIIDEVHMLSNEAFNALLKTFEEPPQNVIFILATTEPHKVIETIVSRCQRFDLRRITTDDITKRLREISDIENIKITDDALYTIAKNVSGGLRDSLALLDQVSILGAKEEISKEVIENILGKMTFDVSVAFLTKILAKNTQDSISFIEEIYNKGLEPKNFCENFIEFLRNIVFTLSSNDDKNVLKFTNFNTCDIEKIKSLNLDSEKIFKILNKVIEFYKEIKYSTNPYLWAELMIINLCRIDDIQKNQIVSGQNISIQAVQNIQQTKIQTMQKQPEIKAQLQQNQLEAIMQNELQPETQSFVKETLKEIDIPEKEPVKEKPKNGEPEHLMEYKENLYEAKLANNVEDKMNLQIETAKANSPSLPKVPGVDDVSPVLNVENKAQMHNSKLASQEGAIYNTGDNNVKNNEINPATAWANVLSAIELIPAKFFFSCMGKLVGINDKRIIIGFINEGTINQAKSDSKFKHLDKAIKSILGADYTSEFILMTPDIKPIEVKLKTTIQSPQPVRNHNVSSTDLMKPQVQSYSTNLEASKEDLEKEMLADMNLPENDSGSENKTNQQDEVGADTETLKDTSKKASVAHYGKKTQEMLEAFNGKVIE